MTTVVTGATGQVGVHLVEALLAGGRRVRALVLPDEDVQGQDVEIVRADVRDAEAVRRAFRGASSVFHLAAVVSTRSDAGASLFSVNVDGTRNIARAAHEAGVKRMVHFSSIVAFNPDPRDMPLDERRPQLVSTQQSPYARSKVLGERIVREEIVHGLDAVIVNPTVIVGPHETHHRAIVQELFAKHWRGELPLIVSGHFNLVDVLDVVSGALLAEQHGRIGESYILGGLPYTVEEALCIAATSCGRRPPRLRVSASLLRRVFPLVKLGARIADAPLPYNEADVRQIEGPSDIRSDKARRELGYRPHPIDDAVRRVHAWLKAHDTNDGGVWRDPPGDNSELLEHHAFEAHASVSPGETASRI